MEKKLIAWARAVKSRRPSHALPPLWVFTDRDRLPDPAALLRTLPKGLVGVVMRPGAPADPAARRQIIQICRARRFALAASCGPWAAGMGRHHARHTGLCRHTGFRTAAVHSVPELVRARRACVNAVFLSPVYPSLSHPGAAVLGPVRWSGLARRSSGLVFALGGLAAAGVGRLGRSRLAGVGVIGAAQQHLQH